MTNRRLQAAPRCKLCELEGRTRLGLDSVIIYGMYCEGCRLEFPKSSVRYAALKCRAATAEKLRTCYCGCGKVVPKFLRYTDECRVRRAKNYYLDHHTRLCKCGCGKPVIRNQQYLPECRKKHMLKRQNAYNARKREDRNAKMLAEAQNSTNQAVWDRLLSVLGLGKDRCTAIGRHALIYGHDYTRAVKRY